MLHAPKSWRRAHGHQITVLTPPQGRARIRVLHRLPPRRFSDVVRGLLAEDPAQRVVAATPTARALTLEGEHAASCELRVEERGGATVLRFVWAILADDFVVAVDGASREPAMDEPVRAATRELALHVRLSLGVRPRRFFYRPPDGWLSFAQGLTAIHRAPAGPRLTVGPAEPSRHGAATLVDAILADEERQGFPRAGELEVAPLRARSGLAGVVARYRGRDRSDGSLTHEALALLADGRYAYPLRLTAIDAPDEALLAALREAAQSAEPIPGASAAVAAGGELTIPWTE